MNRRDKETPSGKETGSQRVYSILRSEILCMRLAPGEPIDENSLAERFNLSRSPIREALIRLSADGLVTMLANRSTVVAPMDFRRIPEFLDALDLLQRITTRLAAIHATPSDLVEIRRLARAYEVGLLSSLRTGDSQPMIETNYDFHMGIADAGRNMYFSDLYRRLLEQGRRMLHLHFQFQTLDPKLTPEEIAGDHSGMVKAIEAKDADLAEHYAHQHAIQFKGRFMQFLDQNLTANVSLNYEPAAGMPALRDD